VGLRAGLDAVVKKEISVPVGRWNQNRVSQMRDKFSLITDGWLVEPSIYSSQSFRITLTSK
jgi:hypothetical protein